MRKIMIIGVGWEQLPLIKEAKKMGLYIVAIAWWKPVIEYVDKVYEVDSRDLANIEKIYLDEKPIAIIADECDYSMYAVSFLTSKYGLPGPNLKTQTITNNKYLQRMTLENSSILQPKYKLCWNMDMVSEFIREYDYPIIIKPIDNRGSIGISKVESDEELKQAWYSAVENSHSRMCIVEQFIVGDVITADGFYDSHKYICLATSKKVMYTQNVNVAKIVKYPGGYSEQFQKEIKRNSEIIAEKIGVDFGFTHIEYILEKETNRLFLVEVANRGGGVFTSNILLQELTDINFSNALLRMALGEDVDIFWDDIIKKHVALYFLTCQGKDNPEQIGELYKDYCKALYLKEPDEKINISENASMGREGVAVISGVSEKEIFEIGKIIEKRIKRTHEFILI